MWINLTFRQTANYAGIHSVLITTTHDFFQFIVSINISATLIRRVNHSTVNKKMLLKGSSVQLPQGFDTSTFLFQLYLQSIQIQISIDTHIIISELFKEQSPYSKYMLNESLGLVNQYCEQTKVYYKKSLSMYVHYQKCTLGQQTSQYYTSEILHLRITSNMKCLKVYRPSIILVFLRIS